MTKTDIVTILNRFNELFNDEIYREEKPFTKTKALNTFERMKKQVLRELLITGCPYGDIWECKKT